MPNDRASGSDITIDVAHAKIHSGVSYVAPDSVTLGAAATRNMVITAPTDGNIHVVFDIFTEEVASVVVKRGVTVTSAGTAITALNHVDIGDAYTGTVQHTVGYTGGTTIWNGQLGTGGFLGAGDQAAARNEFVIHGTDIPGGAGNLALEITSGAASNDIAYQAEFYIGGTNLG